MSDEIRESLIKFATSRGLDKTFCPSEVARKLYPNNWRDSMGDVREVADHLVKENKLETLQKGIVQDKLPSKIKGPIRLKLIK